MIVHKTPPPRLLTLGLVWVFLAFALPVALPGSADAGSLSKEDTKNAKAALQAVDKKRWKSALRFTSRIKNPDARRLLTWVDLTAHGTHADFDNYANFLREAPGWPHESRIMSRAEGAIRDDIPDETIVDFHTRYGMKTGYGKMRLAGVHLKRGEKEKAQALLRDAWINGNFTKDQEKYFYRTYRKHLTKDDHIKRMERLLWDERYWPAKRMLWRVDKGFRALATARLSLMRREGNVDALIGRVPEQYKNDPGLIFERLRWRRRKGKSSAFTLLRDKTVPDLIRPDKWWRERSYLARASLRKGKTDDAYAFTSKHNLKDGADYAEAEWLSGWIALRFMDNAALALDHFERVANAVNYPISLSRAHYWKARALEKQGHDTEAKAAYTLAAHHSGFFYGQLAAQRLSVTEGPSFAPAPAITKADKTAFENDGRVKAARILAEIGEEERLRPFIRSLIAGSDKPAWQAMTGNLAAELGRTDLGVLVAKIAERDGTRLLDLSYPSLVPPPLPKTAKGAPPERPLVLAMIRQESAFHVNARSRANALGLMQILPGTAKRVARQIKVRFSKSKLTGDARYNLTLGQSYLAGLLEEFNGSYIMAVAAYNAGPARVRQWVRNHGDPREDGTDAIDWIEMISFNETRDYVQRVLENLQIYRQKLKPDTKVAFNLHQDLKRPH